MIKRLIIQTFDYNYFISIFMNHNYSTQMSTVKNKVLNNSNYTIYLPTSEISQRPTATHSQKQKLKQKQEHSLTEEQYKLTKTKEYTKFQLPFIENKSNCLLFVCGYPQEFIHRILQYK